MNNRSARKLTTASSTKLNRLAHLRFEPLEQRLLLDARLLADINSTVSTNSSYPRDFFASGDAVYFSAEGVDGRELWKTDRSGSAEQVKDVRPGPLDSSPTDFFEVAGVTYFTADVPLGTPVALGSRLWRTDGTFNGLF